LNPLSSPYTTLFRSYGHPGCYTDHRWCHGRHFSHGKKSTRKSGRFLPYIFYQSDPFPGHCALPDSGFHESVPRTPKSAQPIRKKKTTFQYQSNAPSVLRLCDEISMDHTHRIYPSFWITIFPPSHHPGERIQMGKVVQCPTRETDLCGSYPPVHGRLARGYFPTFLQPPGSISLRFPA